ncbi:hypothetical protein ACLESO_21315 [Pyxidicoccus sp. 3LG]
MRRLIWSGAVLFGLVTGCASSPEKAPEPEVAQPESQPGGAPEATTAQEGKSPIQQIVVTPNPQPKDAIRIEGIRASGGVLDLSVQHGGGCAEHTYTLAWDGELQQGQDGTPVANLVLVHDANGDRCKALLMATPRFDLAPISQRFGEKFSKATGAVDLALPGQATVRYAF